VKVHNVHERKLAAPPARVSALFEDMDRLWPAPVPRPEDGRLRLGLMLWQRDDGATAAYRIVGPPDFPGRHWFEVHPDRGGGTILRHTVDGEAVGEFEEIWRERVEPMHDVYIEALFDRAEEAVS
jgi:hypothetical protein